MGLVLHTNSWVAAVQRAIITIVDRDWSMRYSAGLRIAPIIRAGVGVVERHRSVRDPANWIAMILGASIAIVELWCGPRDAVTRAIAPLGAVADCPIVAGPTCWQERDHAAPRVAILLGARLVVGAIASASAVRRCCGFGWLHRWRRFVAVA